MIDFYSNDIKLEQGFKWAKEQALQYVFENENVGKWYEASLPLRKSFCMRDVSHQSMGAHYLGLEKHTKNMLYKFCKSINESRDYCGYWEIDDNNNPTAVDYTNDKDFWYNLPANFDIINCCYRMFLLTADRDYLEDEVFLNFYDTTVTKYIEKWDLNGDGIPKSLPEYGRRGIASYDEANYSDRILISYDLLSFMYSGYSSYSKLLQHKNECNEKVEKYKALAEKYNTMLNEQWWDKNTNKYKFAKGQNGEFMNEEINDFPIEYLSLYNNVPNSDDKAIHTLLRMLNAKNVNVESLSHFSEIYYNYNDIVNGYNLLMQITNENLHRREYPEVSFATVGAYVSGLMGLNVSKENEVYVINRLLHKKQICKMTNITIKNNSIDIEHIGNSETNISNNVGEDLEIEVCFLGHYNNIIVNDKVVTPKYKNDIMNNEISYTKVKVRKEESIYVKGK